MNPDFTVDMDLSTNETSSDSTDSPPPIQGQSQMFPLMQQHSPFSSQPSLRDATSRRSSTDSGQLTVANTTPAPAHSSAISESRFIESLFQITHSMNDARQMDLTSSTLSPSQSNNDKHEHPDNFESTSRWIDIKRSYGLQPTYQRLSFNSPNHTKNLVSVMHYFRKKREFCDVVLLVESKKIYAHRLVLASASSYFKAMFTSELAEARKSEIELFGMDLRSVEALVNYCYTSRISVDENNVQALLPAACLLQINEVKNACCDFLKSQIDPSNCLGIRKFADTHSCIDLHRLADRFVHRNFLDVVESEEFVLLPLSQLVEILRSDSLGVRGEEQVFLSLLRWIHHDLPNRESHLPELLQHVRLPLLPAKFLVDVVCTNELVRHNASCRDLVDEAKDYLLLPQERARMQGPRTRPRNPLAVGEALFAVGGWCSGDAMPSVERYDPLTHQWIFVAPMNKKRCGVGIGVLHDLLYAVGGHDGISYLNSVERYDPHTNMWSTDVSPTRTCRTSVGVAVFENLLYAVGGQDGITCLNVVERYDAVVNKWTTVTSMSARRLGVGVAVLNDQVYAVGGSDGVHPMATVERFDARVGSWQRVAPMSVPRKHLGVAVFGGLLYAVGGRDEAKELSSAEFYDPRANAWCPVVAMTSRRSGVGLAVVGNRLVAIGGFDGANYLKSAEVYDTASASWRLHSNMNSRRLGGGVGVVRQPNYGGTRKNLHCGNNSEDPLHPTAESPTSPTESPVYEPGPRAYYAVPDINWSHRRSSRRRF